LQVKYAQAQNVDQLHKSGNAQKIYPSFKCVWESVGIETCAFVNHKHQHSIKKKSLWLLMLCIDYPNVKC